MNDYPIEATLVENNEPYPILIQRPFALTVDGGTTITHLAPSEARDFADQLTRLAAEAEAQDFVQVQFATSTKRYVYRDPSRSLQIGDFVVVPVYQGADEGIAQVKARGRGTFTGNVIAEVKSKLMEQPLS